MASKIGWILPALALLLALTPVAQAQKAKGKAGGGAASLTAGKKTYDANCLVCHQADGSGVPSLNPPLYGTSWVTGDKPRLINVILKGMARQPVDGKKYHNTMPAHDFLTDREIADLLTYLRQSFGNKATAVSADEVAKVRKGGK